MSQADSPRPVPVAIIGMGCLFPMAEDLERFWSNIRRGLDAITDIPPTHWRPEDYWAEDPKAPDRTYARRGGFLAPVDFPLMDFGIAPHAVEATDTTQLLGLLIARQALADAGYAPNSDLARDRVSVILGVTGTLELVIPLGARLGHPIWRRALKEAGVDGPTAEDVVARIAASYPSWQENSFPGLLGNVAAGRIANRLDLRGTNCVVDAACASSLGAINLALLELSAGRCDVALSGGIDTFNDIFMYMCFSKTPALSPTGDARPFDAESDGTILGEGLGLLVLKRLDDARRDGDRIYAVIRSVGTSSDGKGQAVYAPSPEGQVEALRRAYDGAGIEPASIELVEAHGTGTRVGDAIELEALERVYAGARPRGRWCALGSVKSQVGHTKAAAGSAGIIKAALALHHKVLPPTIKVRRPIEALQSEASPFYLSTQARPWLPAPGHPRRAAVSAFGFGGSNFHCVLEEAGPEMPGIDWGGDVQILAYSGPDPKRLADDLPRWTPEVSWADVRAEAARSRARFRADHPVRLVLVAERGGTNPAALIQKAAARLATPGAASQDREVNLGTGGDPGPLAILFPGQGSQYVGMLRDLACRFPRMHAALSHWNRAAAPGSVPLSEYIYPAPAFGDDAGREQVLRLRQTEHAQPAIGAVSIGLYRILQDFGVRPALAGGHSFGELTALSASGRIDEPALVTLSQERGKLMAECARGDDPGAMLAVFAPLDRVASAIREHTLDVVIANRNAPSQCVLSGPAREIDRATGLLSGAGLANTRLPVSAAFHSRFVAHAQDAFRGRLDEVEIAPAAIPVYANATGDVYPDDPQQARALLAGQLARPVEFQAQIEAMYERGARTFLEVGPDARLSGLVDAILAGRDHRVLAVDDPRGRGESGDLPNLARALAVLASLGYPVELARWDEAYRPPVPASGRRGLSVKVCGANPAPERSADPLPACPGNGAVDPRPVNPPRWGGNHRKSAPPAGSKAIERTMEPRPTTNHRQPANGHVPHGASPVTPNASPERNGSNGQHHHAAMPANVLPASTDLAQALQQTQETLLALQRMAEQTAQLHRQFLEGQAETQRTIQVLLDRQQRIGSVPPPPLQTPPALVPTSDLPVAAAPHPLASIAPGPPPPPAVPPAEPRPVTSSVAVLLEVVSEKTGYPAEMLELDMQLDADLGIDSIKRVEILSALQDRLPHAPAVGPDQAGTLRTLRQIAEFLDASPERNGHSLTAQPTGTPSATVATVLLEVVSEKTGYPAEMLELDMQLDADLGIDSIKRVEILSALQDRLPHAPAVGPDQAGTLRTLRQIAEFLDASPVHNGHSQPAEPATTPAPAVATVLLEVVSEKTGYPAEMLELDMQLDADLGIDSIKRVEILSALQDRLPHAPAVGPDQAGTLRTLRQIAEFLEPESTTACRPTSVPAPAASTATAPRSKLSRLVPRAVPWPDADRRQRLALPPGARIVVAGEESPLADAVTPGLGSLGFRVDHLTPTASPTPRIPDDVAGLIILGPPSDRGPGHDFIKWAFALLRSAAGPLRRHAAAGAALFATVSRLDGRFGLEGLDAAVDPTAGALAGLSKTAQREWPDVSCRAIDLDPALGSGDEAAARLVDELLNLGTVEVGLRAEGAYRVDLVTADPNNVSSASAAPIHPGEVVVVSGGARGVTAEVAAALAAAYRPRLVLLGRTALRAAEPAWLDGLEAEADIRRALLDHAKGATTPQAVQEQTRQLHARREIRRNLERIRAAGSEVSYHAIDARDGQALADLFAEIARNHGPVRGLVHGAGVLADRTIENQTDAQFAEVYDTKVLGLEALVGAVDPAQLRFVALFSSSTARFGRTGQVAYAAANESLNKWAQHAARRLPQCRVAAFNWGPWDGGMVTPALRPMFEREGLGLIPLEEGARLLIDEMARPSGPVEIVVLAGGLPETETETAPAPVPVVAERATGPLEVIFERQFDSHTLPVLRSHVIDNHAVLPMALILEWLAEGAVHRHPGMVVQAVEELQLFKGLVLKGDRPATVSIRVGRHQRRGGSLVVPVELHGVPASGREVTHARGRVVLGDRHETAAPGLVVIGLPPYGLGRDEIYRKVLFHGPDLQAIQEVEGCGERAVAARVDTAPSPSSWMERPIRQGWLTDPLAIDAAFQVVVLWTREQLGANSLPTAVAAYRQFRRSFPAEGVRVAAMIRESGSHRAVTDIELLDLQGQLVARIEGYECVVDASLNQAFRRNRLSSLEVAAS